MSELEPTLTYSNHTATDELRRLLDERGVEWEENGCYGVFDDTKWQYTGGKHACFTEGVSGVVILYLRDATPEQAIAATFGTGACHLNKVTSFPSIFDARRCDECWNMAVYDSKHEPKFCPYCGRKVADE